MTKVTPLITNVTFLEGSIMLYYISIWLLLGSITK